MNLEMFRINKNGQTDKLIQWIIVIAIIAASGFAIRNIFGRYV